MPGKLSEILTSLYGIIEALTCNYVVDEGFKRWRSLDDMTLADPSPSWRAFRIVITGTGKGTLSSGSESRSKMAKLAIAVNYPKGFFADDDTDALGVENIRADDDALIVNRLCFERPNGLQDAVSNVRAPKWLGSALQGRLWVINLELEYVETL